MATNPNWWDAAPLAPASDPNFTGYIPGSPKPKEPKPPVFVPKDATRMYDPNTGTFSDVPQDPNADNGKDALKEAIAGLGVDELLQSVGRARDNLKSGWATGTWGALAELKPGGGTPRDDFLGNLKAIQGGIILEKLQSLKEASKTGASGMGALSEKEGERLASSVSALTENMSPQAYEQSLTEIARHALTLQAVRDGKDPTKADVAKSIDAQAKALATLQDNQPQQQAAPAVSGAPGGPPTPSGPTTPGGAPVADYSGMVGPDGQALATGKTRDVADPAIAAGVASLIRQGADYSEYAAYVKSKGANPDTPEQYTKAVDYAKGHKGATNVKTLRTENVTGFQRFAASPVGAALAGAGTGATAGLDDNIAGALSWARGNGYHQGRDAYQARKDILSETHPVANFVGQTAGGITSLAAGGAALKGTSIAKAATDRLGRAGAAVAADTAAGAAYGAGEGETLQSAALGAAGGAAGGALGQYAIAPVAGRVANRIALRGGKGLAPDVADAAARQDVNISRPMVDESSLPKFENLKGTENAGPIIEGRARQTLSGIEAGVKRLGQGGNASNREAQGEALRNVAKGIKATNREGATSAYEAARAIQPDAMVEPATMRQQVDAKLQQLALRPNQNQAEIRALKRYRADLDKPLPLQEVRNMRTDAYDNVYGTATRTPEARRADRFMMSVIDGANKDIEAALSPEAMAAYKGADALYKENKTLYKQAFKPLFGEDEGDLSKLSAEQIHDKFKRALNTNGQAIAAFHRRMPLDASRDFAATIAENLGRSQPDAPFDAQVFLNQTKDFSPSAQRTLFGPGGEQSVGDLRLLSRRLLETGALKTGDATRAGYLERQSWRQLARAFLGGVTGMVKNVPGAGAGAAAGAAGYGAGGFAGAGVAAATAATIAGGREVRRVLSARAMMNPRVARWLAQTAEVSSHKDATEATRKLGVIIGREPAIAGELQPLYDALQQRLTQPLAAQPQPVGGENDQ